MGYTELLTAVLETSPLFYEHNQNLFVGEHLRTMGTTWQAPLVGCYFYPSSALSHCNSSISLNLVLPGNTYQHQQTFGVMFECCERVRF